ncbi:YncE family protein [Streptomyces roseus]|uniref:YncE family protein n=1 Tax=Streptomyces roseus TaxID=66430 RepID=UPI003692533E
MSGIAVSDTSGRGRARQGGAGGAWWAPARVGFAGLALLATAVVPSASATTQPVPAPAPAGTFAYVANGLAGSLSVVDTADNTVTSTIDVGDDPNGVAVSPDGNRVSPQADPSPSPSATTPWAWR